MKNENQICEIFKIERYKIRNDFVQKLFDGKEWKKIAQNVKLL